MLYGLSDFVLCPRATMFLTNIQCLHTMPYNKKNY